MKLGRVTAFRRRAKEPQRSITPEERKRAALRRRRRRERLKKNPIRTSDVLTREESKEFWAAHKKESRATDAIHALEARVAELEERQRKLKAKIRRLRRAIVRVIDLNNVTASRSELDKVLRQALR